MWWGSHACSPLHNKHGCGAGGELSHGIQSRQSPTQQGWWEEQFLSEEAVAGQGEQKKIKLMSQAEASPAELFPSQSCAKT